VSSAEPGPRLHQGPSLDSDPLQLVGLTQLMSLTQGKSSVAIGLVDGPVALDHPNLSSTNIREISGNSNTRCSDVTSVACIHGTFMAGILSATRSSAAPAICPGCTLLVRSIFTETSSPGDQVPSATPTELALAIFDVVEAGARVINLSIALVQQSARGEAELGRALDHSARKGIIVVVAAGNQGTLGSSIITRHPWVIPVVAFNLQGRLMALSNLGGSIGRRGVGAPGGGVTSLGAAGGSLALGGTSVATPFVTGTVALLWSCFPDASAAEIKLAVSGASLRRSAIVPPLLDANLAYQALAMRRQSISLWENANGRARAEQGRAQPSSRTFAGFYNER
jgi:subtilisin family serine protease